MLYVILFMVMSFGIQSDIQLNKDALEPDRFYAQQVVEIQDTDDHIFYRGTKSVMSKQGDIFVFSSGNLFKFSIKGDLIKKINIQGSGPGELQRNPMQILTVDNNLVLREMFKMSIYDSTLTHIRDIRIANNSDFGDLVSVNERFAVIYKSESSDKAIFYNKIGELVQVIKRPNKTKATPYKGGAFNPSNSLFYYKGNYLKWVEGEYQIRLFSVGFNSEYSIKKPFTRILNKHYKREIELHKKFKLKAKKMGGTTFSTGKPEYYNSDITGILGSNNNLLFLNIAEESRALRIHVIKNRNKFVSEFYISGI